MEDQELIALQNLKARLLNKVHDLIGKLKQQEADGHMVTLKLFPNVAHSISNTEKNVLPSYEHTLCEVASRITGIKFENVDRKWLKDDLYQYTTHLITKSLSFFIELTVKLKGDIEYEVCDIMCYFIGVDRCYMLEIESWVQNITKMKNFSFLTSAISQYNEQNILRTKILNNLKSTKYATFEQCTEKNGGILAQIHSPNNVLQVYLIFQWYLLFLEQTWQIEHFFDIKSTELGAKFAEKNRDLLQNFCQRSITKIRLLNLWQQLCHAVNVYEDKDNSNMDIE